MSIPPRTRDTVSKAAPDSTLPVPPSRRIDRVLNQADVLKIRAEVDRISRAQDARPQPPQSTPRVVVVFLVSRLGMIPMFLFVILPRKAIETAAPMAQSVGNQFLALTGTFMNLMSRVIENVAEAFAPVKNFAGRVQEGINQAFHAGLAAYKSLQKMLTNLASKIKVPAGVDLTPMMKSLHEWARRVTNFKQLYNQFSRYLSNALAASREGGKDSAQFLAKIFRGVRQFNNAIDRQLAQLAHKLQAKAKQFKDNVIDPVKYFIEAAASAAKEVASAVFSELKIMLVPSINLAATLGVAAKTLVDGKIQNFLEVIRTFASNVQNAAMSVARAAANIYQQLIVQNVILPMMAALQAGWGKLAAIHQRIQNHVVERFNAILRELKDMVKRLAARLQSLFGAIQGWAQRKWKQQWLPALKKIPRKAKEVAKQILSISLSFWKALLSVLKELFWLFAELGRYAYNIVCEAFREAMAQNSNWK